MSQTTGGVPEGGSPAVLGGNDASISGGRVGGRGEGEGRGGMGRGGRVPAKELYRERDELKEEICNVRGDFDEKENFELTEC